jgi:hypothetical protein
LILALAKRRHHPMNLRRCLLGLIVACLTFSLVSSSASAEFRIDGFNVIVSPRHPFGSASARESLALAKRAGATTIAIVPFLWQLTPESTSIVRGSDMGDDELRQAIRDARKLGLTVVIKPHVWVDGSWAGAVGAGSEANWRVWFANYGTEITRLARVAAEERADIFCVGTELAKTIGRPEWESVINAVRAAFSGMLTYAAHNIEEAEVVPFWDRLDVISVTLYPPLGADDQRSFRLAVMRSTAERLDALAVRTSKHIIVGEIGIRSARGAAAKPWESAEEREAMPDVRLQAEVLADWMKVLDRPSIRGVLVWRWFTDPGAGGASDTDFSVQGKPAEAVLRCAWTRRCGR